MTTYKQRQERSKNKGESKRCEEGELIDRDGSMMMRRWAMRVAMPVAEQVSIC